MSRSRTVAALAALALGASVHAACSLGPHQCLRMSDCESPYMCVEGTCITNETLTVANTEGGVAEAGATDQ